MRKKGTAHKGNLGRLRHVTGVFMRKELCKSWIRQLRVPNFVKSATMDVAVLRRATDNQTLGLTLISETSIWPRKL